MPPAWSQCSCELTIARTSLGSKPSARMLASICAAPTSVAPSIRTWPAGEVTRIELIAQVPT